MHLQRNEARFTCIYVLLFHLYVRSQREMKEEKNIKQIDSFGIRKKADRNEWKKNERQRRYEHHNTIRAPYSFILLLNQNKRNVAFLSF